jgi:hypothetical protein
MTNLKIVICYGFLFLELVKKSTSSHSLLREIISISNKQQERKGKINTTDMCMEDKKNIFRIILSPYGANTDLSFLAYVIENALMPVFVF